MAIEIQEKFEIDATIDRVWDFISTPELVVGCLPGAKLVEVVDERNFLGRVKIKLGAVTAAYKGKINFQEVDPAQHLLVMAGEGKDPSGGTAKALITVKLTQYGSGATEMSTDVTLELTGKVAQVGGGMIKGVSHQLFQQFAKTAKKRLETPAPSPAATSEGAPAATESTAPATSSSEATPPKAQSMPAVNDDDDDVALSVLPLLFKTFIAAIANFFRRMFGGSAK